jgi:homoserine kinase type II
MATFTELTLEQAKAVGEAFGLSVATVAGIPAGSVNSNYRLTLEGGSTLFARVYEEQDASGAELEARLLDHLARSGVATPRPLARPGGAGFTCPLPRSPKVGPWVPAGEPSEAARPVALFPWCDGEILCQARITPRAAKSVGEKLAEVHLAGRTFAERKPSRFRIEDMRVRLERIAKAEDRELRAMVPKIRERLDRVEEERNLELPAGIIHSDLFRDNVLWQGDTLAAMLDFESACEGSFAYDLMVTVLAWCYGDDLDERLARAMFEGYAARRPLTSAEVAALGTEARIAALRFTVTRITDYSMRQGIGERVMKDYRRFWYRHERVALLGSTFNRWFQ